MNNNEEWYTLRKFIEDSYSNENSHLNFGAEVNKCLYKMYDYLLENDKQEKEKKYNDFEKNYEQLDEKGKQIIKYEWSDIIEPKNKKKRR